MLKFVVERGGPRKWWRLWLRKWEPIAYSRSLQSALELLSVIKDHGLPGRVRRYRNEQS